jgi:hypothetical protein
MLVTRTRPSALRAERTRAWLPTTWGLLVLFIVFTALVGVRKAHAEPEFTLAMCAGACFGSALFKNAGVTLTCVACSIKYGRLLGQQIWGDKGWEGGYDCAKASIGC